MFNCVLIANGEVVRQAEARSVTVSDNSGGPPWDTGC
jgi:hypothetical protein